MYLSDRIAVLSSCPGRVVETIEPDMPHPGDRLSAGFGELVERVRRWLEFRIAAEHGSDLF